MQHRYRLARLLSCWGFVAALLLKSAVPMLASAAAALQGKAIAEVCDVYGVDTSTAHRPMSAATPAHDHRGHLGHALHEVPEGAHPALHASDADPNGDDPPAHSPSRVAHGGDHCALSALAFALAAEGATFAPPRLASAAPPLPRIDPIGVVDPAARWAARLRHGPPATS